MKSSINTPLPETLADEELAVVQGGATRVHGTPDGTPVTAKEIPLPPEVWVQIQRPVHIPQLPSPPPGLPRLPRLPIIPR